MADKKIKVVTYRSSDGGRVSARWASGPAVKVGSQVVWARAESTNKK